MHPVAAPAPVAVGEGAFQTEPEVAVTGVDMAREAVASASNIRGNSDDFRAAHVNDGRADTYWASDDGGTTATVELSFPTARAMNAFVLREHIALGQRVTSWAIDAHTAVGWRVLASGATIGGGRTVRTAPVKTDHLRVRLTGDSCLTLGMFAVYDASGPGATAH